MYPGVELTKNRKLQGENFVRNYLTSRNMKTQEMEKYCLSVTSQKELIKLAIEYNYASYMLA